MVNKLFDNIVWTQRSNFFEIPTDCPQRDERLGWTGDAQAYVRTASYNADVAAFFTKWGRDLAEAQRENGAYPDYAPYPMQHGARDAVFGTAWMDAGIICPYTIYKVYNDTRLIERHYASMTRFMDFRRANAPGFQGVFVGNDWGDWLSFSKTPIEYIDAVYFAYVSDLMAEMAQAIGKADDAEKYRDWGKQIRAFFNKNYVNEDVSLAVHTQTAYALALSMDMLPPEARRKAGDRLANLIAQEGSVMTTGFLGTKPLLPALTATGHNDLAVRLLQNREYPSWGYEVENGATTIWERWNSYTKGEGFMNPSMNSFSHYSFGAVCEWMFHTLAGIETDGPGYKRIVLRPHPPTPASNPDRKPIDWVTAEYDSTRGKIVSAWRMMPNRFEYRVSIPANAAARVYLPASGPERVREGGNSIAESEGVSLLGVEDGRVVLEVLSGDYSFIAAP
jgi:alpha-L-rhamnosidase